MCRSKVLLLSVLFLTGCIQEMSDQPRYDPLEANGAYREMIMSRAPVPGTIARGQLPLDEAFSTGKRNGELVSELPEAALSSRSMNELLERGEERYAIYCSHCHGQVGGGTGGDPQYSQLVGMVVKRGFPSPPTYHQERLRQAPLGHFFDVITNGTGRMPPHGYLIPPEDRWAIAAYIRALQLSQFAPQNALDDYDLKQLDADATDEP
ncbi:MAG TPA: cytochrome c [Lacipirellulaceae bacterium]|nr:cytochrome c [Lacipirellulaceae bacterium]